MSACFVYGLLAGAVGVTAMAIIVEWRFNSYLKKKGGLFDE